MIKLTMTGPVPGPDTLKIETEDGQLIPLDTMEEVDIEIRPGAMARVIITMYCDEITIPDAELGLVDTKRGTLIDTIKANGVIHETWRRKAKEDKEPDIAEWHRWCTTNVIKQPES